MARAAPIETSAAAPAMPSTESAHARTCWATPTSGDSGAAARARARRAPVRRASRSRRPMRLLALRVAIPCRVLDDWRDASHGVAPRSPRPNDYRILRRAVAAMRSSARCSATAAQSQRAMRVTRLHGAQCASIARVLFQLVMCAAELRAGIAGRITDAIVRRRDSGRRVHATSHHEMRDARRPAKRTEGSMKSKRIRARRIRARPTPGSTRRRFVADRRHGICRCPPRWRRPSRGSARVCASRC